MENSASQLDCDRRARLWREPELWLLVLLVSGTLSGAFGRAARFGARNRVRARVAYEMLQTGDWIVPRQQGEIYLSRPGRLATG